MATSTKNKHIADYLNDFVLMPDPRYAVLLKGKWGCGKTYFIQSLKKGWENPGKDNDDEIVLNPIYISLYGLSSVKSVTDILKSTLNPLLYSKTAQTVKKIVLGAIKLTTKIDFNNDGKEDATLSYDLNSLDLLIGSNEKIKGNKILIFDDVERCKIPLDELFGYINNFVEHNQCKVILLADEQKLDPSDATANKDEEKIKYKDFKEKLIGQTFEVEPDYLDAIETFLSADAKGILAANKDIIYNFFLASQTNNLRILRQCFSDFNRLENLVAEQIKTHSNYDAFIKELLCYFIIFYCEYKAGNTDVESYQDYTYTLVNTQDELKAIQAKYEGKYLNLLTINGCHHSSYSLGGNDIIHFIKNGSIDSSYLNEKLKNNRFFSNIEEQPWEKLWDYWKLTNKEFYPLYKEVKYQFEHNKVDNVYIVLHISGIFLSLNSLGIIRYSKHNIVEVAKRNIGRLIKTKESQAGLLISSAYGKQYQSLENPHFKEIQNYYVSLLTSKNNKEGGSFLRNYWENLTDSTITNIYDELKKPIPDGSRAYEMTSIFKPIDSNVFARQIMQLNNESKRTLIYFFSGRYYLKGSGMSGKMCGYHKGDLKSLEKLVSILIEKNKKIKSIDRYVMTELINTLNNVINKLKSSAINEEFESVW